MISKARRIKFFSKIDIYPVISSEFCKGRDILFVLKEIAAGGAKIVQLREKNKNIKRIFELACEFRKICDAHGMLLIINDHIDIALASGADGVHLGQDDLPLKAAGKIAPELIIGISTHSLEEALEAQKNGADYINIGPIYPTRTKNPPITAVGIETLKKIIPHLHIPFTVMGGVKKNHFPDLIKLGAMKIAMVTEITQAENIREKVRELRDYHKLISKAQKTGKEQD